MKIKSGKEEVIYLLKKVFEKYELETGDLVIRNTNRKNYEAVSRKLSEISNELPESAEKLNHEPYTADYNINKLAYPSRKYDITASQVKDASLGLVNNPRVFLIDACYIYLFGIGRKGFVLNPQDNYLLVSTDEAITSELDIYKNEQQELKFQIAELQTENENTQTKFKKSIKKEKKILRLGLIILLAALAFSSYQWTLTKNKWETIKKDMKILPYNPSQAEVDSLEGIWLCYTGSPQARRSDNNRFHMVVANILEVKYKNDYFTFTRYGANFDHVGYMQYELAWLVSIHSRVRNTADSNESPRHSLMRLDNGDKFIPVISASWSFDVGDRNNVIGIREVYVKQGKGGQLKEILNTPENASCKCKIVNWERNGHIETFYLKNQLLDSLPYENLKTMIDEKSIILSVPQKGLLLSKDSIQ